MRLILSMTALMSFITSTSMAVLPPAVYRMAAKNAMHHVQVKVLKVVPPKVKGAGACQVTGEVVRIFRDKTKKLKLGRKLTFAVSCKAKGDTVPPGPTIWKRREDLVKAKFIEAALNSDGKRFSVARWNSSIIKARSKTPRYGFPFHKE